MVCVLCLALDQLLISPLDFPKAISINVGVNLDRIRKQTWLDHVFPVLKSDEMRNLAKLRCLVCKRFRDHHFNAPIFTLGALSILSAAKDCRFIFETAFKANVLNDFLRVSVGFAGHVCASDLWEEVPLNK